MPAPRPRILLVGHCAVDSRLLERFVRSAVPEAEVRSVHGRGELDSQSSSGDVLLVNRVLDGRFDASSGAELIGEMRRSAAAPVALLVSNRADAQAAALKAGAEPGFGKNELDSPTAAERLRDAVAKATQSTGAGTSAAS